MAVTVCFQAIGVGAGQFLGVRTIFARISPNLSEKFPGNTLCEYFLPHRSLLDDLQKSLHVLLPMLGANFSNQTTLCTTLSVFSSSLIRISGNPCTPASYTTGPNLLKMRISVFQTNFGHVSSLFLVECTFALVQSSRYASENACCQTSVDSRMAFFWTWTDMCKKWRTNTVECMRVVRAANSTHLIMQWHAFYANARDRAAQIAQRGSVGRSISR